MKEILFKGKTHNGNWEEGNIIITGDECYILSQKSECILKHANVYGHWYINKPCTMVIPDTVCQFTGKKDKNGDKIFEGDYDENGNMVVWCDRSNGWQFAQIDVPTKDICIHCHWCDGNFDFSEHIDDFVIVGNIHDISVSAEGICSTCRFADRDKDVCTAGTYWAEKGFNKICYGGELWEATER